MTEVETELDSRYDDVDVDSILARCRRQGPITFSRKRCIYQAPEFIKRLPSTEEVEEGSTVTFACKVAGFPAPNVTWYKDDEIITSESRAKIDSEESGIHSIKLEDVSRCDAGIYKIHASNLEGSSKSMLYIAVKARSKRRNKKKKRTGNVACAQYFPAIIEREAEEQKEMLEIALQPDSPLTPLYCTISRKAPVMWPAFLGDWAYSEDETLQRGEIEELGDGCEDVFDLETDESIPGGLTFISTAYAEIKEPTKESSKIHTHSNSVIESKEETNLENKEIVHDSNESRTEIVHKDNSTNTAEVSNHIASDVFLSSDEGKTVSENKDSVCDILNNNGKTDVNKSDKNGWEVSEESRDITATYQTEVKQMYCDPSSVSAISVHRSYATGDTTSSVARRSPSPFSRSQNLMSLPQNGLDLTNDTTTLQNLNNERILYRMNQKATFYHRSWCIFRSIATCTGWDDHLAELILLICGSTFLALCLDLPPTTFVMDIIIAMIVKFILSCVLDDN